MKSHHRTFPEVAQRKWGNAFFACLVRDHHGIPQSVSRWGLGFAFACLLSLFSTASSASEKHGLTIDDLFGLNTLSGLDISPDGEWIAATIIRPADANEVYGRTFYEMDTTRADVWLISSKTGERRNLTQGKQDASGFWCPTWSPDGRRLAMLSTKPEGNEPRGGDNVRLYVWDSEKGRIARQSPNAMMTQTLGGSALYRVDMRGLHGEARNGARCNDMENAPFVWRDSTSLLVLALPKGGVSGNLDAYTRGLKHAARTLDELHEGAVPTATSVESGRDIPKPMNASLQLIDVVAARAEQIATLPAYPLDGGLQMAVAPDGRSAAVLASIGAIPHAAGQHFAYPYASWAVDKQLGFVDLSPGSPVRWVAGMPKEGRYLLDLLSWSPNSGRVAIRARPDPTTRAQQLFVVSTNDLSVQLLSPPGMSVMASAAGVDIASGASPGLWMEDGRVLMRAIRVEDELSPWEWYVRKSKQESMPRADWWVFAPGAEPLNVTQDMPKTPESLRPTGTAGEYVGLVDRNLWSLDIAGGKARKLNATSLPDGAEIVWPRAQGATAELLIAGKKKEGRRPVVRVRLQDGAASVTPLAVPGAAAEFEAYAPDQSMALFSDPTPAGTFLWATGSGRQSRKLLSLNEQMANVAWGKKQLFDYRGSEGDALKAAVILPPDYRPGRKYPVLVWVYAGSVVRDLDFLGPYKPGQYNLQLYAAKGYVVLVPSMPLKPDGAKNDDYIDLPKGVMPAIDRLIDMGIADPDRLAVMGQSYGGYSTYSLVTYTNRFKAAIAMAGLTDLVSAYGQFDTTARSYPGIEHQKSANWGLSEGGQISMGGPPSEDLWHYLRNSPLYFADRVQTPLLLIHGEQDIRGPMTQAEEFFFALYRKGSRAKLLRYWGEDHGLRQSPANVRDIVDEIFGWLEANMPEKEVSPEGSSAKGKVREKAS